MQLVGRSCYRGELNENCDITMLANFISAHIFGKISQFQHSNFKQSPLLHSEEQWELLHRVIKEQQ